MNVNNNSDTGAELCGRKVMQLSRVVPININIKLMYQ